MVSQRLGWWRCAFLGPLRQVGAFLVSGLLADWIQLASRDRRQLKDPDCHKYTSSDVSGEVKRGWTLQSFGWMLEVETLQMSQECFIKELEILKLSEEIASSALLCWGWAIWQPMYYSMTLTSHCLLCLLYGFMAGVKGTLPFGRI